MSLFDLSRWREISPYLDQVLDCESEARAVWLEKLRTENPAMAADIEALLAEQQALDLAGFLVTDPMSPGLSMPNGVRAIGAGELGTLVRNFRGLLSYLLPRFRSVK
jgi:hypothetical protein